MLAIPWIVLTIIGLIFGLANLIRSIQSLVLYIGLGSTFFRWSSYWSFDQDQTEENIPSHFQHTLRFSCVWSPPHGCPQSLLLRCCLVTQVSEITKQSSQFNKGPSIYYVIQIWGPERPPPPPCNIVINWEAPPPFEVLQ